MKYFLIIFLLANFASAADLKTFRLTCKDGVFEPTTIQIPQGEKVQIEVQNIGTTAEEFESVELNREKVVTAGKTITVFIGPLTKGEYKFFGDFHKDTAQGKIIAQ